MQEKRLQDNNNNNTVQKKTILSDVNANLPSVVGISGTKNEKTSNIN